MQSNFRCGCTRKAVEVQSSCKRTTWVWTLRPSTVALSSLSFLCQFSWDSVTASAGEGICTRVISDTKQMPLLQVRTKFVSANVQERNLFNSRGVASPVPFHLDIFCMAWGSEKLFFMTPGFWSTPVIVLMPMASQLSQARPQKRYVRYRCC